MFWRQVGRVDRVLGFVAEFGGQHGEAVGGQRAADQVEVGGVGEEQGIALVFAGLKVLRAGFDGGQLGVGAGHGGLGFNHAEVVKVPGHRTRRAHLPLAKQHAHFRRGAVHVVGQAFNHDGHAVRRKAFVDNVLKVDRFTGQARTLLDGALQRFFGHGDFARLLHHQTQSGVGGRVGAAARGNHDVLGQAAKQFTLGVGRQFFAFSFPLRAHVLCFLGVVARGGAGG